MTEAELLDNAIMAWSSDVTTFSVSITIISGYLIVAYIAGAALTRSQVTIINGLFFGTILFLVGGLHGFRASAADFEGIAWAITTQRALAPISWVGWGTLAFVFLCALTSGPASPWRSKTPQDCWIPVLRRPVEIATHCGHS